jgi:hypothetical protein
MAVKLENCTEEEQRSAISFLWAEGVPGGQIHQRMCVHYGGNALSLIELCMSGLKCLKMAVQV